MNRLWNPQSILRTNYFRAANCSAAALAAPRKGFNASWRNGVALVESNWSHSDTGASDTSGVGTCLLLLSYP